MKINLAELSKKTGKSELECAKLIAIGLEAKAKITGVPQKIRLGFRESHENNR